MKEYLYSSKPINYTGYVGVPAPEILEYDEWFGYPPETEKSIEIRNAKKIEEEYKELYADILKPELSVEPNNIHELMYQMATQNTITSLNFNLMPDLTIGGSENYQGGYDSWQSGTGYYTRT